MPEVYEIDVTVTVRITVNDPNVIDRCVNNELVELGDGTIVGWGDHLYNLPTRDDVLRHLAFNALMNGYEDLTRLDGWADLPREAATLDVDRWSFDVDRIRVPEVADATGA